MRTTPYSSSFALVAIYCVFSDVSAFLPFKGRHSALLSVSKTETHHLAFLNAPHRRRDTQLNAEQFSQSAAATQSFISVAPLLLAPLAALAAGSQALSNKDKLELDVYATEIELEEIKQKLKNSQIQATSSFALALASAGFVAANTFGSIAPTSVSGNAFSDTMAKTEVLSPSQQNSASLLVEKMEAVSSSTIPMPESPSVNTEDTELSEPSKEEINAAPNDAISDPTPLIASKTEADAVMSKLDLAMKEFGKSAEAAGTTSEATEEESTAEAAAKGQTESRADGLMSKLDEAITTRNNVASGASEQPPRADEGDAPQTPAEPKADNLMSMFSEAMTKFSTAVSKDTEPVAVDPGAETTPEASNDPPKPAADEVVAGATLEPKADNLMSKLDDAVNKFNNGASDSAGSDSIDMNAETKSNVLARTDQNADRLMSKLDEAMNKYKNAASEPSGSSSVVEPGAATIATPNVDEPRPVDENIDSSAKLADKTSPFDSVMAKLEASTEAKETQNAGPGLVDSTKADAATLEGPATSKPVEGETTAVDEALAETVQPNVQSIEQPENLQSAESTKSEVDESLQATDGPANPTQESQETEKPSVDETTDITAATPLDPTPDNEEKKKLELDVPTDTTATPETDSSILLNGESPIAGAKQDTPKLKEDDVFPTSEDAAETPAKDQETAAPILAVPAVQPPASSTSVPDIRIPGLEYMDPAVYQSAAAIAAGAVLVGILASVGDDTATMPVGKKEESSDYLDGLTRSSTTTGSKPDKPSSYVEQLNKKPAETLKATVAPGMGSYLENLSQSKQTAGSPGYGLPNASSSGAKLTPPIPTNTKPPLTVTNASQGTVSRPPEDPRALIPKSQFSPPTDKSRTASEPPKQVSLRRVDEPPKNVPGLSYLESMAVGAPKKIPPPVKRNTIGNVAKNTARAVPGLSYLERMAEGPESNGAAPPNGTAGGQPVVNGSPPPFQSFSDGFSGQSSWQIPPNGASPSQAAAPFQSLDGRPRSNGQTLTPSSQGSSPPFQTFSDGQNGQTATVTPPPQGSNPQFQSYSDGLSQQNGEQEATTVTERMTQTNVGSKADQPKPKAPAGFGSYLDSL